MDSLSQIGKYIAVASFVIGTILTSIFLYFDQPEGLEDIGFFYTLIAFIINSLYFLFLFIIVIIRGKNRQARVETGLLMLVNIPIAALYAYLIISLHL